MSVLHEVRNPVDNVVGDNLLWNRALHECLHGLDSLDPFACEAVCLPVPPLANSLAVGNLPALAYGSFPGDGKTAVRARARPLSVPDHGETGRPGRLAVCKEQTSLRWCLAWVVCFGMKGKWLRAGGGWVSG